MRERPGKSSAAGTRHEFNGFRDDGGVGAHLPRGFEGVDGGEDDPPGRARARGGEGFNCDGQLRPVYVQQQEDPRVGGGVSEPGERRLHHRKPYTLVEAGDASLLVQGAGRDPNERVVRTCEDSATSPLLIEMSLDKLPHHHTARFTSGRAPQDEEGGTAGGRSSKCWQT